MYDTFLWSVSHNIVVKLLALICMILLSKHILNEVK